MAGFTYEQGACACFRDKCSYDCETYRRWNPPPPTNADRIRAMTDEELAEFMGTLPCCPPGVDVIELCRLLDSCEGTDCEGTDLQVKCWLDWLRQEETT